MANVKQQRTLQHYSIIEMVKQNNFSNHELSQKIWNHEYTEEAKLQSGQLLDSTSVSCDAYWHQHLWLPADHGELRCRQAADHFQILTSCYSLGPGSQQSLDQKLSLSKPLWHPIWNTPCLNSLDQWMNM